MEISIDLYKELALERTWDEKKIRESLKGIQKQWIRKRNACNDKNQLLLIEKVMVAVEQAFRYLTKPVMRKQYDKSLEEAYKKGIIKDEQETKMNSVLDQALEYYKKGNIKLAVEYAQEAINGNVNNPLAWDTLARCYYIMENHGKALDTVDAGLKIFTDNIELNWLGARIATVGTHSYEDAQKRINRLIEIAPDRSVGYAEQIFLHLSNDNEELAFQEIDKYIEAHPQDNEFKRNVAYDVIHFSNSSFIQDPQSETYIIADKNGYERCLKMREKAFAIYKDDFTEQQVDRVRYYGTLEFNKDNTNDLLWMYGIFLYVFVGTVMSTLAGSLEAGEILGWSILCLALAAPPILLTIVSFRPYWQLNRIYLTGDPGLLEKTVVQIGRIYTWLIKKALWLFWTICKWIFYIIVRICTRGF